MLTSDLLGDGAGLALLKESRGSHGGASEEGSSSDLGSNHLEEEQE